MKYLQRNLVASYVNSNGVRVFIPERIRYNGETYVAPYRFSTFRFSQYGNVIYSRDSILDINIRFANCEITATEAFTESSLNTVMRFILSDRNRSKSSGSVFTLSKSQYEALL